jgi:hypothetical protein
MLYVGDSCCMLHERKSCSILHDREQWCMLQASEFCCLSVGHACCLTSRFLVGMPNRKTMTSHTWLTAELTRWTSRFQSWNVGLESFYSWVSSLYRTDACTRTEGHTMDAPSSALQCREHDLRPLWDVFIWWTMKQWWQTKLQRDTIRLPKWGSLWRNSQEYPRVCIMLREFAPLMRLWCLPKAATVQFNNTWNQN